MFKPHINEHSQKISKIKKTEDVLLKKLVQETDQVNYYEVQQPSGKKSLSTKQKTPTKTQKSNQKPEKVELRTPRKSSKSPIQTRTKDLSRSKQKDISTPNQKNITRSVNRSTSRSRSPIKITERKSITKKADTKPSSSIKRSTKKNARSPSKHSRQSRSRSQSREGRTLQGLPLKQGQGRSPYSKSK